MAEVSYTGDQFAELVRKSRLVDSKRLDAYWASFNGRLPTHGRSLAEALVHNGFLTPFQAQQLLAGKWKGFLVSDGKYKLLELLGIGGMGRVYLAQHLRMQRLVALKVLPVERTKDQYSLERFNREARAAAALDHPNIVRAHDIDTDGALHFLVMEYVDGSSLHELVKKHGPLDITRACHYISQAAEGLQHAHEAGLIHRDIKPGNLLLDRAGTLKLLDLGLARFDEAVAGWQAPITQKYDRNAILGTADYLAPEQAYNSSTVDIRADIYSLGCTLYYLLAGKSPYDGGSPAEKILRHRDGRPESLRTHRPNVPAALDAVVMKMMARDPKGRFGQPIEVVAALAPWTGAAIPPPPEEEMPKLCPALESYALPGATQPLTGLSGLLRVRSTRTGPASSASQVRLASSVPAAAPPPEPRRWGGWPIVASLLSLVVLGIAAGWAYDRYFGRPSTNMLRSTGMVLPAPESGRLYVSKRGGGLNRADLFAGVGEALKAAHAGDHIYLLDDVVEAQVQLDDAKPLSGVSVESGLLAQRSVIWRAPLGSDNRPLVQLGDPGALAFKNIAFDGGGRLDTLLMFTGNCGGLSLSDGNISGYRQVGLRLADAHATESVPVTLHQLHWESVSGSDSEGQPTNGATHLDVAASRPLALAVKGGRFAGLSRVAVSLRGPVRAEMAQCRFLGPASEERAGENAPTSAILVAGWNPQQPSRLALANSICARFDRLLTLDGFQPGSHRVELSGVVLASGQAWCVAEPAVEVGLLRQAVSGAGNVARPGVGEGGVAVVPFRAVEFPVLDKQASNDRTFLRYPRKLDGADHPLLHSGPGSAPAGMPQSD